MDWHSPEDNPQSSMDAHAIRVFAAAVTISIGFSSIPTIWASQHPCEVGRAKVTIQIRSGGTENWGSERGSELPKVT